MFFSIIRNVYELVVMLVKVKLHGYLNAGTVWSVIDLCEERFDSYPETIQFIAAESGEVTTAGMLELQANKFANWGLKKVGLKQRDTICLMMLNRADYVAIWVGMAKIGVSTALLNTNITGKPFLHSVEVSVQNSDNKIVVIDNELKDTLGPEIETLSKLGVKVILYEDLLLEISDLSPIRPPKACRNLILESDPILFVFTSGTTGLPKAAKITSTRLWMMSLPPRVMAYIGTGDRVYCPLPLYHSAGGLLGVGGTLLSGATLVFRRKFSASQFTSDCVKYNCTSMQYIGELCRFLINSPSNPNDSQLKIRYAFGNGLRSDVWELFQRRYGVGRIIEFYSATEANVALFNTAGKVGALGCIPRFLDFLYPVQILMVNPDKKDEPFRDPKTGLCRLAPLDVPGLVVSKVNNKHPISRFDGYTDESSSNKKILRDVFSKGDCYFNSGDLLKRDWMGFFYWCDRVGDTFRWKGENVATTEVEHVLASVPFIGDVSVYGVNVPNNDGRAGMASIVLKDGTEIDSVNWNLFHEECTAHLPAYARPHFIRVQEHIQMTGTFKHQKNNLVADGFNPALMKSDKLFFYSPSGSVVPLTTALYAEINAGNIKV